MMAVSTLLAAMLVGTTASAQEGTFGSAGQFVFSGERLAGVYWLDVSSDTSGTFDAAGPGGTANVNTDTDTNRTKVGLLGNNGGLDFATVPRVGFDYFVVQNISLGLALIYISDPEERDETTTLTDPASGASASVRTETDVSRHAFVISPRVGYGLAFADHLGVWARGGITYGSATEEQDVVETGPPPPNVRISNAKTELSQLSLSLDAQLIIIPVNHFGIGIGAFVEVPLTGSVEVNVDALNGDVTRTDGDLSLTTFGLTATILGWL
jgi:hypothetical protein